VSSFLGRTLQVVRDLSHDEQLYLYSKTRELKRALVDGDDQVISRFSLKRPEIGAYLFFMEDSTRTKESFRNAIQFHGLRLNDFNTAGSSFKKKESITDTIEMLVGYSRQSLFVIRSRLEGTCRWLGEAVAAYCAKLGLPPAVFINAGDGRHEHPTQEFLDEFSFLEQSGWNNDHLHIALVGDLYHGRTVHSKVDGLGVFKEVEVDLIAPDELEMPGYYRRRMEEQGFRVREFESIDSYLSQPSIAPAWYFTRLQLERMGDRLLDRAAALRESVTFRRDHLSRLPDGVQFYHPLPRHQVTPVIPTYLDELPLNGWSRQSVNGYYTRIVEIALLCGLLGEDFEGEPFVPTDYPDDFVKEVAPDDSSSKPEYKIGIKPVENGIVIDHIGRGGQPGDIWNQIDKVRRILGLDVISSHGVFSSRDGRHKGIISLPTVHELTESQIKTLGASAPGSTLNIIENRTVVQKFRMEMPPRVYNLQGISCRNPDCISYPDHYEPVQPEFLRAGETTYICKYCERPHEFSSIWHAS
jgi:aspartate carbamoyltransferase